MRTYYVYILASSSRRLYVGVTNDLLRRVWEHRYGETHGFTRQYRITRLVHYETFSDVRSAIAREKDLKRRHRPFKVRLIQGGNSRWLDRAADWFAEPVKS